MVKLAEKMVYLVDDRKENKSIQRLRLKCWKKKSTVYIKEGLKSESPLILVPISASIHWKTYVPDIFFTGFSRMFKHCAFNIYAFHFSCLIFHQGHIIDLPILQMIRQQYKVPLSFQKFYIHSRHLCFQLWMVYSAPNANTSKFKDNFT